MLHQTYRPHTYTRTQQRHNNNGCAKSKGNSNASASGSGGLSGDTFTNAQTLSHTHTNKRKPRQSTVRAETNKTGYVPIGCFVQHNAKWAGCSTAHSHTRHSVFRPNKTGDSCQSVSAAQKQHHKRGYERKRDQQKNTHEAGASTHGCFQAHNTTAQQIREGKRGC